MKWCTMIHVQDWYWCHLASNCTQHCASGSWPTNAWGGRTPPRLCWGKYAWKVFKLTHGIMHLMISQGDEPIKVQKAVAKIKEIIQQGIDVSIYQSLIDWYELCVLTCILQYISLHSSCCNIFYQNVSLAAPRRLQPAAPDAAKGAGDAQWHPQRGRHC